MHLEVSTTQKDSIGGQPYILDFSTYSYTTTVENNMVTKCRQL